ncbi:hypothetical protein AB1N83_000098 [Pleurotus pulmonarius]
MGRTLAMFPLRMDEIGTSLPSHLAVHIFYYKSLHPAVPSALAFFFQLSRSSSVARSNVKSRFVIDIVFLLPPPTTTTMCHRQLFFVLCPSCGVKKYTGDANVDCNSPECFISSAHPPTCGAPGAPCNCRRYWTQPDRLNEERKCNRCQQYDAAKVGSLSHPT